MEKEAEKEEVRKEGKMGARVGLECLLPGTR